LINADIIHVDSLNSNL